MNEPTKSDAITQRLHAKADAELRRHLEEITKQVWDETGHNTPRPDEKRLAELEDAIRGIALPKLTEIPWIGSIMQQFIEVSFLYMRDNRRKKAVDDFMQKVESIQDVLQ